MGKLVPKPPRKPPDTKDHLGFTQLQYEDPHFDPLAVLVSRLPKRVMSADELIIDLENEIWMKYNRFQPPTPIQYVNIFNLQVAGIKFNP